MGLSRRGVVATLAIAAMGGCGRGVSIPPTRTLEYCVKNDADLTFIADLLADHARQYGLTFADKSATFQQFEENGSRHRVIYMAAYRDGYDEIVVTNTSRPTDRPLIVFFPGADRKASAASELAFASKLNRSSERHGRCLQASQS